MTEDQAVERIADEVAVSLKRSGYDFGREYAQARAKEAWGELKAVASRPTKGDPRSAYWRLQARSALRRWLTAPRIHTRTSLPQKP